MPRFTYFVPGARTHLEAQQALQNAGLGDILQKDSQHFAEVSEGPGDGKPGVLMTNHEGPGTVQLVYRPDTQVWTECGYEEGARFWIGYTEGEAPGPADLARPELLPGWKVRLADGRDWTVPVALAAPYKRSVFPKTMLLKAGGAVERDVQERYKGLDAYAREVYDSLTDDETFGSFSQDETITIPWASRALSMNYYAGEWELGAVLGCFTTETLGDALLALIDWPTMDLYGQCLDGKKNVPPDFYRRFAGFVANFQSMSPATPTSSFTES